MAMANATKTEAFHGALHLPNASAGQQPLSRVPTAAAKQSSQVAPHQTGYIYEPQRERHASRFFSSDRSGAAYHEQAVQRRPLTRYGDTGGMVCISRFMKRLPVALTNSIFPAAQEMAARFTIGSRPNVNYLSRTRGEPLRSEVRPDVRRRHSGHARLHRSSTASATGFRARRAS
jgi:hypothetical protein